MDSRKNSLSFPSQIPVPPQPLHLRTGIPVNDIAFVILEAPGDDDEDVPFTDPDLLLDLALDSPQPGDPVKALHPDVVGPHHQFGLGKHLPVPLLGKTDPDDFAGLIPVLECLRPVGQPIISSSRASPALLPSYPLQE